MGVCKRRILTFFQNIAFLVTERIDIPVALDAKTRPVHIRRIGKSVAVDMLFKNCGLCPSANFFPMEKDQESMEYPGHQGYLY